MLVAEGRISGAWPELMPAALDEVDTWPRQDLEFFVLDRQPGFPVKDISQLRSQAAYLLAQERCAP